MKNEDMGEDKPWPIWPGVIGIAIFLVFMMVVSNNNNSSDFSSSKTGSGDGAFDVAADTDSARSYAIDRVDRTLLPQEREEWASDPNSYGFNENDRVFLEEHGVSESEARAMETILRENGVD